MTDLPILRTEVYDGALNGDDRNPADPTSTEVWFGDGYTRYPNAMGSQTGKVYVPGPAALSDTDPGTRIRMSSAWAADWVAVMDGAPLAQATDSIVVTIEATPTYLDPNDVEQYFDLKATLYDWAGQSNLTGGMWFAYAYASFRLLPGQTRVITWTIDEAWLNITHANDGNMADGDRGYHWYDTDAAPHSLAAFRDRLMAAPDSVVGLHLTSDGGAQPFEVDVTRLSVSVPTLPVITAAPQIVRRAFT